MEQVGLEEGDVEQVYWEQAFGFGTSMAGPAGLAGAGWFGAGASLGSAGQNLQE